VSSAARTAPHRTAPHRTASDASKMLYLSVAIATEIPTEEIASTRTTARSSIGKLVRFQISEANPMQARTTAVGSSMRASARVSGARA
jgi:hypothetical protein